MTTPEPTIAEQIRAAEQAGNWQESGRLKAAQLADLSARANHNGHIRTPPEAAPAAVPPAAPSTTPATPEGAPPAPQAPTHSLLPGGWHEPPPPTLPEQIAAAERSGDWNTARRLKTAQLAQIADQMNGVGG